jgi:hypothetical protein
MKKKKRTRSYTDTFFYNGKKRRVGDESIFIRMENSGLSIDIYKASVIYRINHDYLECGNPQKLSNIEHRDHIKWMILWAMHREDPSTCCLPMLLPEIFTCIYRQYIERDEITVYIYRMPDGQLATIKHYCYSTLKVPASISMCEFQKTLVHCVDDFCAFAPHRIYFKYQNLEDGKEIAKVFFRKNSAVKYSECLDEFIQGKRVIRMVKSGHVLTKSIHIDLSGITGPHLIMKILS